MALFHFVEPNLEIFFNPRSDFCGRRDSDRGLLNSILTPRTHLNRRAIPDTTDSPAVLELSGFTCRQLIEQFACTFLTAFTSLLLNFGTWVRTAIVC